MAFRDDKVADRARIEALEAEVRELRAREAAPVSRRPDRRDPVSIAFLAVGVVLVFVAFGIDLSGAARAPWDVVPMITMQLALLSLAVGLVARFVVRPRAGEAIVLSGRSRMGPDGNPVAHRTVLPGGRALRFPFLEQMAPLDLRSIPIAGEAAGFSLHGAVRVGSDEPLLSRAIERFLDCGPDEIARSGASVVENVARVTTERQPSLSGEALDRELSERAGEELGRLGLRLEQLHATAS